MRATTAALLALTAEPAPGARFQRATHLVVGAAPAGVIVAAGVITPNHTAATKRAAKPQVVMLSLVDDRAGGESASTGATNEADLAFATGSSGRRGTPAGSTNSHHYRRGGRPGKSLANARIEG